MATWIFFVPREGARCIILDVPQPIGNCTASRDRPERVLVRRGRYRLVRRGLSMVTLVGPANVRVHLSQAASIAVRRRPKTLGLRILTLASRKGDARSPTRRVCCHGPEAICQAQAETLPADRPLSSETATGSGAFPHRGVPTHPRATANCETSAAGENGPRTSEARTQTRVSRSAPMR